MTLKVLGLIISTLANLIIATYVLYKKPKKIVNQALSLLIYNFAIWSLVNLLVTISKDIKWVTFWGHWCFAAGNLVPIPLLYFSIVFPKPPSENNKLKYGFPFLNYSVVITGILLIFFSFTKLIQRDVYLLPNGTFRPIPGLFYPLFIAYIIGGVGLSSSYLLKKWKTIKTGVEAIQLKIIFNGMLTVTFLAIVTCAILPALGFPQLISIGPVFSVMIAGFIAYSIIRYRLLDITVAIKKTAIYTLLTGAITAFYIGGVLLAERLFRGVVGYQTFFPAIFAALVVAFVFLPLREKIQALVDKMFGKKKYEYQRVLKQVGNELSKVLPLPKLLKYILRSITDEMGIDGGVVYLREASKFRAKSWLGNFPNKKVELSLNCPLAVWMLGKQDVIIREELERMGEEKKFQDMKDSLGKIGAEIVVPIIREDSLLGMIFLKGKTSADVFTGEDIDLLLTLANQAGVAIENARLYTQVEQAKVYQENILKNLANAVIVTDKEDKIRIFNEKAQQITGLSASSVMGKNYRKILPKELSQAITDVKKFGKGFSSYEIEYSRDKKKSDRTKPAVLGVGTVAMKEKGNRINGVILVLTDLTEIRTLEHQLNRAEELATVGTLAAGMAHEIKNPLVAINTFFELLPQKYDDPQFREEFSASACEEVKKINDLIHRLLNFAQPKSPNFTLNHIHKCIDESLKFMNTKLNSYNIEVIKKYSPDVPESYIDKTRFDEIILNLMLNAIEAMEKGGKLYITTSYEKSENTRQILLKIRDTGMGISAENLQRIFDPFFTMKDRGTGLGLAIVYRAVIDHGGNIEVKSEVGKGTTFIISLPFFLQAFSNKLMTVKP
ncbi:MAG: ATP-binding protein [Candidatus Ratteibacteria bacterium]|nr:ATP-binding protein [Candidatus Ratteibacteria bacterium]